MQGRLCRRAIGAACPCIIALTVPAATPRAGRQAAAGGGAGGERSEPPASIKWGGLRVALCAARKPGYLFGSVPRLQRGHGAARRDVEHPPRGAPKGQQARKVRPLARASAATQGRANAARMGWSRL